MLSSPDFAGLHLKKEHKMRNRKYSRRLSGMLKKKKNTNTTVSRSESNDGKNLLLIFVKLEILAILHM